MKKLTLLPVLVFMCTVFTPLLAQKSLYLQATAMETQTKSAVLEKVGSYKLFDLNAKALHTFAQSHANGSFGLRIQFGSSYDWDIVLQPSKVHDSDFKFIMSTGEAMEAEKHITYQGYLKNEPEIKVRMTISNNYIFGLILDKVQHVFETVERTPQRTANDLVAVYESSGLNTGTSACGHQTAAEKSTQEAVPSFPDFKQVNPVAPPSEPTGNNQQQLPNTYCPKLGITLDWQGLQKAGSLANFNADLQTIINVVNGYFDVFNVAYVLNPVYVIAASPNPWADAPGNQSLLTQNFAAWAFPNLTPTNYNCALLFTGTNMNGISYAYYKHMCVGDNSRYGEIDYQYVQPITQRANITTHELGHLWDARHTGTSSTYIMSPSVWNGNLQWDATASNVITTNVNTTFATCLPNCSNLGVTWASPLDGQAFANLNPVSFSATATADGSIAQVEFFVDNTSVGVVSTSPYTLTWTPPAYGTYTLKATATDDLGATISQQINIGIWDGVLTNLAIQLNASSDDAEERASTGVMDLSSSDLELVYDGTTAQQQVGMRFRNVNIPVGATITNAYIQFTVDETDSGTMGLNIYGQNLGNPPTFTQTAYNISSRAKTSASVSWAPVPWTTLQQAGLDQQTPNLSDIVQAIVGRSDWAVNNAMVFIVTGSGERTAEAFDGSVSEAPVLHVSYTLPSTCGTVTGLSTTAITPSGATFNWATLSGANSYDIDYKTSASSTWISVASATTATSATTSGLVTSTLYDWRVRANCTGAIGAYASAQFTTLAAPTCGTVTGLSTTAVTTAGATFNWAALSGASSYDVDYKSSASSTWISVANATTATMVSISGLAAGTLYDWRVRANCTGATGTYASVQFTTTPNSSSAVDFDYGASWKYLDNGTNQGTAWRATSFNDAAWASGNGQLGYGDSDETTVVSYGPNPNNKYITTYFRKTINIADPMAYSNFTANVKRDDGVVVYVNGVEVFRDNLGTGTIYYNTLSYWASDDGETPLSFNISPSAFVAGNNTIAVEIHQTVVSNGDITFDMSLTGTIITPTADFTYGAWWKYLDNGSNQGTAWTTLSFNDATWASGIGQLGYGDYDETTVVSYGSNSSNKYVTTYFRKTITIADPTTYTSFTANVKRDDGIVVYINGVEVFRDNMGTGTISYNTLADLAYDDGDTPLSFSISPSAFVTGNNVIAVEIHQTEISSSDISFDMELLIAPVVGALSGPASANWFNAAPVDLATAAIEQSGVSSFLLVPNPASNFLQVYISDLEPAANIRILDINGRLVLQNAISKANTTIDVSEFTNGIYIVSAYDANGKSLFRAKFLKQ